MVGSKKELWGFDRIPATVERRKGRSAVLTTSLWPVHQVGQVFCAFNVALNTRMTAEMHC
jgi:hypothetical protein